MDKRYSILIVSVTILVLCLVEAASATTWTVNGSGGADFTGIQDAINNASDGDTILVHSGIYYENVVVNKSVTLKGIGHPVVDANSSGSAITLTDDRITLVGFNATNAESSWPFSTMIHAGIKVISNNNNITGNNVSNNNRGISISDSSNNTITGNNVNNNKNGIYLGRSSNNSITGNNVSNNNRGIDLSDSSNNNTITSNTFVNDGLSVYDSYQNIVEDNTVNGKPLVYLEAVSDYKVEDAGQIILINCNNITVENLDLPNTDVGVHLLKTRNCRISNNTVCNNNRYGIRLYDSRNNRITGNNVNNNDWDGIRLDYSSNNNITGNNASSNRGGIGLFYSSNNNTITGNNVSNNNEVGIGLYDSSNNNTITGNVFVNDGLFVYGTYQNTVGGNTVNGKPLVYLKDVSDYKVEDAGQVILVNCDNITIENLDLSNTSGGIALWKTENSKISNNTVCNNSGDGIGLYDSSNNNTITGNNVSNNSYNGIGLYDFCNNNTITGNNVSNNNEEGIFLYYSSNNTITGNNVSNNWGGIRLWDSNNNNTITGNNVSNNNGGGISLYYSSNNNTLTGNNVCNNSGQGIDLFHSSSNKIFLNNFIKNNDAFFPYKSANIWNSTLEITYTYDGTTYESYLGNYWDDYEGTDADGDGIGDTHYSTYSKSDDYPLMKPIENYILP